MGRRQGGTPPGVRNGQQIPTMDEPGREYGERQQIAEGLKRAPLPEGETGGPAVTMPPPQPMRAAQMRGGRGGLPRELFDMDPGGQEPTTTGVDIGEGPGREVLSVPPAGDPNMDARIAILDALIGERGSEEAIRLKNQITAQMQQAQPAAPTLPGETGELEDEFEGTEDDFGFEEEMADTSSSELLEDDEELIEDEALVTPIGEEELEEGELEEGEELEEGAEGEGEGQPLPEGEGGPTA